MSDPSAMTPRVSTKPVSWFTVTVIFVGFALFLALIYLAYRPTPVTRSYNTTAEMAAEDQAWRSTPEGRKAYLAELNSKQQTQATSYAWIDQSKGVVQVPLARAMELTVQDINQARAKK